MLPVTRAKITFAPSNGEVAEWSNALVLKTSEGHTSGGSNPSFSADYKPYAQRRALLFSNESETKFQVRVETTKPMTQSV